MCGFLGFGRARDKSPELYKLASAKNMGILIFKKLHNYSNYSYDTQDR